MIKNKYIRGILPLGLLLSCLVYTPGVCAEVENVHARVTREALSGVLCDDNLNAVIQANVSQDAPGSDAACEKRRHFDVDNIAASLSYINREKLRALNAAVEADTQPDLRATALRNFGMMLHCAQDFYTRSNYVELQLESAENRNDPYNIPLVDWSKVPDKISGSVSGTGLKSASISNADDALNKDSGATSGGKIVVSGKVTYHSVAADLAVRETQRQWNLFEALVSSRCGGRAPAVLSALRKASAPTKFAAESDMHSAQTILGDPQNSPAEVSD